MTVDDIITKIKALGDVPGADIFIMGYSLLGRPMYGVHIGSYSGDQILIQGAIHAREYITSLLLIEQIRYISTQQWSGGFYFIPLMNPDGVALVLGGVDTVPCDAMRQNLLYVNGGNTSFGDWKADAYAVDLNVNFDADWGQGDQNVFCPAPGNFVGYYPESEREVQELVAFANKVKPSMTISYHTRGEVIYYGFEGQTDEELARDNAIASNIAEVTGYEILRSFGSVGGFKDWTTRHLRIPAVTIEVGNFSMSSPITEEYLPEIFQQNKDVPIVAMNSILNIASERAGKKRGRWANFWK